MGRHRSRARCRRRRPARRRPLPQPSLPACVAGAAASKAAPVAPKDATDAYQNLVDAANAVVTVNMKALPNARSIATLGEARTGSGVAIAPGGLVLTIGYLILEADSVEITTNTGCTVPATVAAYDHATGFGLLRPVAAVGVKPIRMGSSRSVAELDQLMIVAGGGEDSVSVATVVSRGRSAA